MAARNGHELPPLTPTSCLRAGQVPPKLCLCPSHSLGSPGTGRRVSWTLQPPASQPSGLITPLRARSFRLGERWRSKNSLVCLMQFARPFLGHEAHSAPGFPFPLTTKLRVMSSSLFWARFPRRAEGDINSFRKHLLHTPDVSCSEPCGSRSLRGVMASLSFGAPSLVPLIIPSPSLDSTARWVDETPYLCTALYSGDGDS